MKKNLARFAFSILLVLMIAPLHGGATRAETKKAKISLLPGIVEFLNNRLALNLDENQIIGFIIRENIITIIFLDGRVLLTQLPD